MEYEDSSKQQYLQRSVHQGQQKETIPLNCSFQILKNWHN